MEGSRESQEEAAGALMQDWEDLLMLERVIKEHPYSSILVGSQNEIRTITLGLW